MYPDTNPGYEVISSWFVFTAFAVRSTDRLIMLPNYLIAYGWDEGDEAQCLRVHSQKQLGCLQQFRLSVFCACEGLLPLP